MKFLKRKIFGLTLGTTLVVVPTTTLISCGCNPSPETKGHIDEPTAEQKHKEPEAGVLSAEYRFALNKEYSKNDFSVSITDSKTGNVDSDITFEVEDVQGKELICLATWKKDQIVSKTCTFNIKFNNSKDNWDQEIKDLSLKYTSNKVLESIKVVPGSFKTTYDYGNKLDTTGLAIQLKAEGSAVTETIDYGFTTAPENGTILNHDNNEITVTCEGKTDKVPLTINAVLLDTAFYTTKTFKIFDVIKKDDIYAKAYYSNASEKDIKDQCVFPEIDDEHGALLTNVGTNSFNVYWNKDPSVSTSFGIMANEGDLQRIQITFKDPTKVYEQGDKVFKNDLVVEAIYPSGDTTVITNYTVSPEIPETGYALNAGENTFTFSYTDYSGITKTDTLTINVVVPVLSNISVSCRRRQYDSYWYVKPSDFIVTAHYTNAPSKIISYDSTGAKGYTTVPAQIDEFQGFGNAKEVPQITFKYTQNGVEKEFVHPVVSTRFVLEYLNIDLSRNQYEVGESIVAPDIYVYGKFKGVPDMERLDYGGEPGQMNTGFGSNPTFPYKFVDGDVGHKPIKITTDWFGTKTSEDIGDKILITQTAIAEMDAYPRSSEQYYVGDQITKDDIVVDVKFKSGRVVKDYKDWECDEQFPITLTSSDLPDRTIKIKKYDAECLCTFPVKEHEGSKIKISIDPTSVGLYDGQAMTTIETDANIQWQSIHGEGKLVDDSKFTFVDSKYAKGGKRKFGYWSLSNSFEPLDDTYHFGGGETIIARFDDTLEDKNLIKMTADVDSKITFTNADVSNGIMYCTNRGQTSHDIWVKVKTGDVAKIPANSTLYLRAENDGNWKPKTNIKIEGQVYIDDTSNARALHTAGGLDDTDLSETSNFSHLFENSTGLYYVPRDFFPYGNIHEAMYEYAFANCTNLFSSPDLLVNELKPWCYYHMFDGCTNLIYAPQNYSHLKPLKFTKYPNDCMNSMFKNCISLTDPLRLDENITPTLEVKCFEDMYLNDFGCAAMLSDETIQFSDFKWFKLPNNVDPTLVAKNMFCHKGVVGTPEKDKQYYASSRQEQSNLTYSFSSRGGRYFWEEKQSRENVWSSSDPRFKWDDLSEQDKNNEWITDAAKNVTNLIRGNKIVHEASKKNDNYRQVAQKIAFKIIIGPNTSVQDILLNFNMHCYANSNQSFFWTNTRNIVGFELFQSTDPNYWPEYIGDTFIDDWRGKYDIYSFHNNRFWKELKGEGSKDYDYKYPLKFKNETNHKKVFTIYFVLSTAIDGNMYAGTQGDKKGSITYTLTIKQV